MEVDLREGEDGGEAEKDAGSDGDGVGEKGSKEQNRAKRASLVGLSPEVYKQRILEGLDRERDWEDKHQRLLEEHENVKREHDKHMTNAENLHLELQRKEKEQEEYDEHMGALEATLDTYKQEFQQIKPSIEQLKAERGLKMK